MNKRKVFWLFIFMLLLVPTYVHAVTLKTSDWICYKSNGTYNGVDNSKKCSTGTRYKYFTINGNNAEAYCTELNVHSLGNSYSVATATQLKNWGVTDQKLLIAGKCIELVKAKYKSKNEAFLYATQLVNYVMGFKKRDTVASKSTDLMAIYNEAKTYYKNTVKATTALPAVKLSGSQEMDSTNKANVYMSEKITLSGLVANYGGGTGTNNGDTTYTVSAAIDASNGGVAAGTGFKALICDDAAGSKNCATTRTVSKPNSASAYFYVRVDNGAAGQKIKVTVNGKNKSSYPAARMYYSSGSTQRLAVIETYTAKSYSRTANTELTLNIYDSTKHTISVSKVDEDGNPLTGSNLILYKANKTDDNNTQVGGNLSANANGSAYLSYSVTKSDNNDDFFNWKYCVKETQSPAGFILKDSTICYTPVNKDTKTCLNGDGEVMEDGNYCGASYTCDDYEGYAPGGDNLSKCIKTVITDPDVRSCEGKGTLNTETGKCESFVTLTEEGATCSEGTTQIDNKCYTYLEPDLTCSSGDKSQDDGKCHATDQKDAVCVGGNGAKDSKYCATTDQYMQVVQKGANLTISKINNKTSVSISKKAATGDDEVPGANLKICSSKPNDKGECTAVTLKQKGLTCPTVYDEENDKEVDTGNCTYDKTTDTRTISVDWVSSDVPVTWTGLPIGTYYLVETLPPSGYVAVTTATEFTINADGSIKTGSKTATDNMVVLNKLTEITISKDDIATSKEVPGATISICGAGTDENGKPVLNTTENGECAGVVLADGSTATWVSGDKPHKIVGLPVGTYYLVEQIAPSGYSTAESIVFTLKADGTLVDKDGKSLADNKIIMHDKKIGEVKTGMFGYYVIFIVLALACAGGVGSYFFLRKNNANNAV